MPAHAPQIDFSQIDFPSDRLTVKALRAAFPTSFDRPGHEGFRLTTPGSYGRQSTEDALGGLIDAERVLAALAFRAALGLPPGEDEALMPRWEVIESLASGYARLGLAAGEHHAAELIRGIEAQAAEQGRRHLGPSR